MVLSWIVSPILSGIFVTILYGLIRTFVLRSKHSFKRAFYVSSAPLMQFLPLYLPADFARSDVGFPQCHHCIKLWLGRHPQLLPVGVSEWGVSTQRKVHQKSIICLCSPAASQFQSILGICLDTREWQVLNRGHIRHMTDQAHFISMIPIHGFGCCV